jgi:hypothetical protein
MSGDIPMIHGYDEQHGDGRQAGDVRQVIERLNREARHIDGNNSYASDVLAPLMRNAVELLESLTAHPSEAERMRTLLQRVAVATGEQLGAWEELPGVVEALVKRASQSSEVEPLQFLERIIGEEPLAAEAHVRAAMKRVAVQMLEAKLASQSAPSGWQPIESAPNPTPSTPHNSIEWKSFLVWVESNACTYCVVRRGGKFDVMGGGLLQHEPTHWMPLPLAPWHISWYTAGTPHTCHDMNPPFPGPCRACETERQREERLRQNAVDALPPAPDAKDALPPGPDPFAKLLELPENWDTYGGAKIDPRAVEAARRFQAALLCASQSVVPICSGGVQIEMHRCGFDFEVAFNPDGTIEEAYAKVAGG